MLCLCLWYCHNKNLPTRLWVAKDFVARREMSKLNADHGMTIITATHDPMVMAHAGRQVHLLDGHIDRNE